MSETEDLVREGLQAWVAGDLDALESVLDPDVTLRWITPGDWDCLDRMPSCGYCASASPKVEKPLRRASSSSKTAPWLPHRNIPAPTERAQPASQSRTARWLRCSNSPPGKTRSEHGSDVRQGQTGISVMAHSGGDIQVTQVPVGANCACCENRLTGGFVRLWPPTNIRVCYDCLDWMNSQRTLQIQRAGGPVPVIGHEPIFRVIDVERAVQHYQMLGFRTDYHDDTYAFAHLGNLTVHLARDDDPDHHMTGALYIHVEDADQFVADWRTAGATVEGPRDEDYGKREGRHLDPDSNLIRFGSPIRR
jgi:hypothetical protein